MLYRCVGKHLLRAVYLHLYLEDRFIPGLIVARQHQAGLARLELSSHYSVGLVASAIFVRGLVQSLHMLVDLAFLGQLEISAA